jgi:hypothetical protein
MRTDDPHNSPNRTPESDLPDQTLSSGTTGQAAGQIGPYRLLQMPVKVAWAKSGWQSRKHPSTAR